MNAQYGPTGENDWTGRKRDRGDGGQPKRGLLTGIVVAAFVVTLGVVLLVVLT